MIVQPELIAHPKFIQLKAQLGNIALEYLVRIWGHCQQNQRGQFWIGASADYVEVVCTGKAMRGKVFNALRQCGWIHERDNGIDVHDWNEHNANLCSRWNREKGYRKHPASKPAQTPASKPAQGAAQTTVYTTAQTTEGIGGEGIGEERRGVEGASHSAQPFAEVPTVEEVRTWADMAGVDPDYAERLWHRTDENHGWVKNKRLVDWRKRWLGFWLEDQSEWVAKKRKTKTGTDATPGEPPPAPGKVVIDLASMYLPLASKSAQ